MKKKMTRNIVIMLVATILMGIGLNLYIHNTSTVPATDNTTSLTDGTYTSSAQGCLSEVSVTVTVTGGKVTDVAIDASSETPELGGKAAEALADQLTQTGSTAGVDAVAGATMTSNAVFTAMDDCLAQAGTGSAAASLTDGTYTSSAKGCLSDVAVTVTVSGGKVSDIAIDASNETPELGGAAATTLQDALLANGGSTDGVDAVSGATLTSDAIFTAVNDCLSQAQ